MREEMKDLFLSVILPLVIFLLFAYLGLYLCHKLYLENCKQEALEIQQWLETLTPEQRVEYEIAERTSYKGKLRCGR